MYSGSNVVKLFGSADDDQSLPPDHSANPENMALGYINLFRSLKHCSFFKDHDKLACWIHMLLSCTHKPYKTQLGRKPVELQPGQFISSNLKLASEVGLYVETGKNRGEPSEKKARNIVEFFESEGMISREVGRNGTVFTVLKFEAYQGEYSYEYKVGHKADKKGGHEVNDKSFKNNGLSRSGDSEGADLGRPKGAAKQEKNLTELPKGNSCPGSVPDEPSKVTKVRPDAAVQTREGKKWGTQTDLDIARRLADDVARIVGGEKDRRSDQELCDWANQIRIFRTTPRDSGQYVTHEHMLKIWDFAHENPFWNENLQSPHKLRKHWGKLVLEYKRTKQAQTAGGTTHATGQPRTEYQRQRAEVDAAINNWQDTSWADDFINNGEI